MKYFILFIDDFSCYCYQYLAASILDVFCQWVERQLDRKVKVVRSDRGVNSLESMMKMVNVQIHSQSYFTVMAFVRLLCLKHLVKTRWM